MNKVKTRVWRESVLCADGKAQEIYYTISDFYEGARLYIHPECGAIFAINPDTEHYQQVDFEKAKTNLSCPLCNNALGNVLPYPQNYRCTATGTMEHHYKDSRAALLDGGRIEPPAEKSEHVVEFWDPFS